MHLQCDGSSGSSEVDPVVTHRLTKLFNGRPAIHSVSLRVPKGSVYVLLGRNGAGKSTAIRTILGLIRASAGSATLLGDPSDRLRPETKARIAYLAEEQPMYGRMSVGEAIDFAKAFYDRWDAELLNQILGHFQIHRTQEIRTLSRGQRSQIALAIAVAPSPELLLLDDPTAGLDTVFRIDFLESLLQIIHEKHCTILMTSHILRDVERLADHIGILVNGVLRVDCTLDTFRASIKKVFLEFDHTLPILPNFDGLISCRQTGNSLELVTVGFEGCQRQVVETLQPKSIEVSHLSVEDAFIEYTRTPARPLPMTNRGKK